MDEKLRIELKEDIREFTIAVNGKETVVNIDKVCAIHPENLVEEFTRHPATYAWWATVLALYEVKKEEKEGELELIGARIDSQIRQSKTPADLKLLKEKDVEAQIVQNEKYLMLRKEFLDTKLVCKRLAALVKGLESRHEMLVQTSWRTHKEESFYNKG